MSLFDRIRQGRQNYVPDVEVAEPVVENVAESPAVETPIVESPAVAPESPESKRYTYWWQTPDYLGEVERRAASAEKRAEQDRKRVRRERNVAILGDIAKLGAQTFAKEGGAWKIPEFTPATEKANDKLAALRERHAAEVAAFARERAAARQAQIADNNNRMRLENSLAADAESARARAAQAAYDRAWNVYKQQRYEDFRQQELDTQRRREDRLSNNANRGSGSDNGVKVGDKWFSKSEHGDDWYIQAYNEYLSRGGTPLPRSRRAPTRDEVLWAINGGTENNATENIEDYISNQNGNRNEYWPFFLRNN